MLRILLPILNFTLGLANLAMFAYSGDAFNLVVGMSCIFVGAVSYHFARDDV